MLNWRSFGPISIPLSAFAVALFRGRGFGTKIMLSALNKQRKNQLRASSCFILTELLLNSPAVREEIREPYARTKAKGATHEPMIPVRMVEGP